MDKALDTKFSKGSLSGWVEVLKYSAAGRPGAAVLNAGLEEEEGREGGCLEEECPSTRRLGADAPVPTLGPGTRHGPRLLEYSTLDLQLQGEWDFEDVVQGLFPSLGCKGGKGRWRWPSLPFY